jgi:hypothetical protein
VALARSSAGGWRAGGTRLRVVLCQTRRFAYACVAGALVLPVASCGDPVHDDAVAALGPEDPNVPRGPLHRPGQPCLLCHRDGGAASPFGLGGTVYMTVTGPKPVANVTVLVFDATNAVFTTTTNCVGNFFVRSDAYTPVYPIWATLRAGRIQRDMDSPAHSEGSCAGCHTATVGPTSPGPVYLIDEPTTESPPPGQCN